MLSWLLKEFIQGSMLQDIVRDDEIKLDWFFKASLIHDLVNVSVVLLLPVKISY